MSKLKHRLTFRLSHLGLSITLGLALLVGLLLMMSVAIEKVKARVAIASGDVNPVLTKSNAAEGVSSMNVEAFTPQTATATSLFIPAEGAYLGAYIGDLSGDYDESLAEIRKFEELTGRRLAIVHRFWGMTIFTPTLDAPFGQYADFDWLHLDRHFTDGRVVMISWNPVNSTMAKTITYQSIIDGRLDYVLTAAAQDAAAFGKPLFIRWSWEMDGNWYVHSGPNAFGPTGTVSWTQPISLYSHYGDTTKADGPERFVDAWRHIHALFQQAGADNVIWVWSPNWLSSPIPTSDQITTTWNLLSAYYPGDDQVDWIGTSIYYRGDKSEHQWLPFTAMYNHQIGLGGSIAQFAKQHKKPVMIAEIGAAEKEGDPLAKAHWITTTYRSDVKAFPEIKAILWFSVKKKEDSGKEIDWPVGSSSESLAAFKCAIADPYYLDRLLITNTYSIKVFLPMIRVYHVNTRKC